MPTTVEPGGKGVLGLARTVWRLGFTSLATDAASESVYPLLPVFLSRVLGASAFSLGVIEGVAEGINSLLKIASGYFSDRWRRRQPIVVTGYGLSSAVRPLIALVTSWPQVLAIRVADRVGKGTRTAPRDAILAAWAEPHTRGRVYGFHRAMDHIGAIVGPTFASLFLLAFPDRYRVLFALTAIPGAIAVWLLFGVEDGPERTSAAGAEAVPPVNRDQPASGPVPVPPVSGAQLRAAPTVLSGPFLSYLAVLLIFTLGNSSDAFLLLRFTDLGVPVAWIPLVWAALHGVKALSSVIGGAVSDVLGRRPVIVSGWAIYAGVYAGFAATESVGVLLMLFMLYGLYYGLTEGTEKALVADLVPAASRGTAFGVYNAVLGVGALGASLIFGAVWTWVGPAAAFGAGAALALTASVMLFAFVPGPPLAADR
ncbi:MAG: MFS transporter [Vicinamibacterales bacterium]